MCGDDLLRKVVTLLLIFGIIFSINYLPVSLLVKDIIKGIVFFDLIISMNKKS